MKKLILYKLYDYHDCETCGSSDADGYAIKFENKYIPILEPFAHCYHTRTYYSNIIEDVLSLIGLKVVIVRHDDRLQFKISRLKTDFVLFQNRYGDTDRVYYKGKLIFKNSLFLKSYHRKDNKVLEILLNQVNIKLTTIDEELSFDPSYYDYLYQEDDDYDLNED